MLCCVSCGRANVLLDREVGDDEELVGLCQGRFVGLQAAFSLGGGGSMLVKDLNSYTEATLMAFVKGEEAPSGLVPSWLDETGLRRRLRDYQSPTLAKKAKSEGSDSLVLERLDMSRLCSPADVLLPVIGNDEPEFCAEEGWLTSVTKSVLEGLDQVETPTRRVAPMALVRCSRGGKTRALEELAHSLRKGQPGLSVVFVSFNNYSVIKEWEHADPVSALCRRIAFAALNLPHPSKHDYDAFAKTLVVTVDDVVTWLHGSKCVLLIDELNLLKMSKSHAADFTDFLKTRFLLDAGRFFVFSSHVMPSSESLSNFMDNMSNRGVNLCQLPLIPSLVDARRKLECPTLAIREALFRARVPALISVTLGKGTPTFDKRQAALESVSALWSDNHVMELLRSFVSGHAEHILEPLLQLMSSNRDGIVWIPFHMQHVLRSADVERLSPSIHGALRIITDLLCESLLKNAADPRKEVHIGDVWQRCALVAGWTVNSRHVQGYCKQAFLRCLVSSRLVQGGGNTEDEVVASVVGVGCVTKCRLNPKDFHGLAELQVSWPESVTVQLWMDSLSDCIRGVLHERRPDLKGRGFS